MRPGYRSRLPSSGERKGVSRPATVQGGSVPARGQGRPLAVSELLSLLNQALVRSFPSLVVKGEVVDPTLSRNGHLYFRLRDGAAEIRAVIWRSDLQRSSALPQAGEEITVRGSLTVYSQRGDLQMKVVAFHRSGLGELLAGLNALRERLKAEGALDRPKRALPPFPKRIGLVTSVGSAVLHDVFESLRQRNPSVELLLSPSLVTGPKAAIELREATERLWPLVEVIIIARGGGSFEELLPFSDEALLRTVLDSPVPVVAAVGHGSDSVLLDLVADLCVPTPTAAAVAVVPERETLLRGLQADRARAFDALERYLRGEREELGRLRDRLKLQSPRFRLSTAFAQHQSLASALRSWADRWSPSARAGLERTQERLAWASPARRLVLERERLAGWKGRCEKAVRLGLQAKAATLNSAARRCSDLGPEAVLRRGFALLLADGRPVVSSLGRSPGEELEVRLGDGRLRVRLIESVPDAPESSS